jgi:hypothetical protein
MPKSGLAVFSCAEDVKKMRLGAVVADGKVHIYK